MCDFYEISRSGYYAWKKRDNIPSEQEIQLVNMIEECQGIHKRKYGYRRVGLWLLHKKGVSVNHKKILRLTRKYGLQSVIRRRRLGRYKPNGNIVYANILNRDFYADCPNKKWVTDISYIVTPGGTLYLSAIRDLFDNYIVSHKTARRQDYNLVENTIRSALEIERPTEKIILHSDQGGQYRSYEHKMITEQNPLIPSMSAPGTPGDNACAENFFSIFKTECIRLEKPQTPDEAEVLTNEFLDYYNYRRLQLRSGLSPYEERRRWYDDNVRQ